VEALQNLGSTKRLQEGLKMARRQIVAACDLPSRHQPGPSVKSDVNYRSDRQHAAPQ
jgi:hypothetical protein